MKFLRKHWYDVGGVLSLMVLAFIYLYPQRTDYESVLWLSLVSLFFHQLEEYRIVGTFPGFVNKVMFKSENPDRYPLNTNTAFYVNVFLGWFLYLLAALFGERAVWLGIASILISLGNVIAHSILFNIKGKTFYNAGLASCWLFFVPCIYYFFKTIYADNLVTYSDYLIGIPLGILFNIGIFKGIGWLADKNTTYIFDQRNVLPKDRENRLVE